MAHDDVEAGLFRSTLLVKVQFLLINDPVTHFLSGI
jgi:hypothetical protein